jgi:hypothetical protein
VIGAIVDAAACAAERFARGRLGKLGVTVGEWCAGCIGIGMIATIRPRRADSRRSPGRDHPDRKASM